MSGSDMVTGFRTLCAPPSLIANQLPRSPVTILAGSVEYLLDVPVQRPHCPAAREHRRAAEIGHRDQGFHRSLPLRRWTSYPQQG